MSASEQLALAAVRKADARLVRSIIVFGASVGAVVVASLDAADTMHTIHQRSPVGIAVSDIGMTNGVSMKPVGHRNGVWIGSKLVDNRLEAVVAIQPNVIEPTSIRLTNNSTRTSVTYRIGTDGLAFESKGYVGSKVLGTRPEGKQDPFALAQRGPTRFVVEVTGTNENGEQTTARRQFAMSPEIDRGAELD